MYELLALPIVVQLTRDEARSAWPDAPVVTTEGRPQRKQARLRTAMALRWLADQLDASGRQRRPRTA
jgi:hypothetical protein